MNRAARDRMERKRGLAWQASAFLTRFSGKVRVVVLTLHIGKPDPAQVAELCSKHGGQGEKLIGVAGRMASEKGVEVLLDAAVQLRVRVLAGGLRRQRSSTLTSRSLCCSWPLCGQWSARSCGEWRRWRGRR